jgi:hypothetical protein
MRTRPPVASRHLTSLGDDAIPTGIDANGLNVMLDRNYYPSWSKLYEVASQGKIGLRGRPAIGLHKIEFRPVPPLNPWLSYEKRGELEEIPAEKIKAAGVGAFFNIAMNGFLNDGVLCPTEFVPETAWAYTDLEVNARQLVRWFHPVEGKALRFGDEVILLEPEVPRAEASSKVVATENVGGRPPTYPWDEFAREMIRLANGPDGLPKGPKLTKHMRKWCEAEGAEWKDGPCDSTLRDRIAGLLKRTVGGGAQKRDWYALPREMLRLARTELGLPERPALIQHVKEWYQAEWGDEPSDSMISDWIDPLYPAKRRFPADSPAKRAIATSPVRPQSQGSTMATTIPESSVAPLRRKENR